MRNLLTLLVLMFVLLGATSAIARGGRTDDCPAGSTDPDCADTTKTASPGK